MERKYTDRDVKTTFKRIKWPSIDKFWPFQEDNIFFDLINHKVSKW